MTIKSMLFPEHSRTFLGKRWLDIILRTIHLLGLLGLAGGFLFAAEKSLWFPYFLSTILSGLVMISISLWSNAKWILQNRGLAIILKLFLLLLIPQFPGTEIGIIFLLVIISGLSSHAPAKFRYYSIFHGKEI